MQTSPSAAETYNTGPRRHNSTRNITPHPGYCPRPPSLPVNRYPNKGNPNTKAKFPSTNHQ